MSESQELYEFRKKIKELKEHRGRGTELISVYITPGYPISDIAGKLRDEYGQASNIKSKSTQKNVQAALEKIMAFLKTFRKTPENGVAIFAGNVSKVEGQADLQLFYVVPPVPLTTQFYRCESVFVTEPLEELVEHTGTYGLVVLDGKDATIALLKGKNIKVLRRLHSTAQQKQHHGGQCIHSDELVQFADGKIAPIASVRAGDVLVGVDLTAMLTRPATVSEVVSRKSRRAISISISNPICTINVTPEHRFFVINNGKFVEKTADELREGEDLLFVKEMAPQANIARSLDLCDNSSTKALQFVRRRCVSARLSKKQELAPSLSDTYYDLTLPETSNFIVNGFCVHNSAARFQRIHEETVEKYFQRIGEAMDVFLEQKNFQGVIVGGPGPTKENFLKLKTYNYQLKILGVVDTGYAEEHGLKELMEKSQDILSEQEAIKEKKLLTDFIQRVANDGLATYGLENVHGAVFARKASMVIATEDLTMLQVELKCDNCGREERKIVHEEEETEPCTCGHHMKVLAKRDLLQEVLDEAEKQNLPIELVSRETPEGSQFLATFKGIGALLRYK